MSEKYYLVFARQTPHGLYTDFVPCDGKCAAQQIGDHLIKEGQAQDFVIIRGELITQYGQTKTKKE